MDHRLSGRSPRFSPAVLLLVPFFCSGAAALIAQLCWLRMLTTILGGSSAALNVILITFMGGLAIGAALAKRLTHRVRDFVLLYAVLEGLLCVYLFASPYLVRALGNGFVKLLPVLGHETLFENMIRLVVAGTAFILPTVVMGMTTPILITASVERVRETASWAGLLYGINTLGAATGALLAGCYLILAIGVSRSLAFAAGLNLVAALLALIIVKVRPLHDAAGSRAGADPLRPRSADERRLIRLLCVLAFFGGFAGMALEVILARMLMFVIGGSYYSHTISIGGFLLGIVAGSLLTGLLARRWAPKVGWVPLLFCIFGLATLVAALLFEVLPMGLHRLLEVQQFAQLHFLVLKLTAALLLVLLPAMASGMILPYLIHLLSEHTQDVGNASSDVLFFNTVGSVAGVLLTGYVLIEWAGARNSIFGVGMLCFLMALYALNLLGDRVGGGARLTSWLGLAGMLLAAGLMVTRGNIPLIVDSVRYAAMDQPQILYYAEDEGASVSVTQRRDRNARGIMVNGLMAGEVEVGEVALGSISDMAMLAHPDPRSLFIAGVGSGRTAGVAGLYRGVNVLAVEISEAVISALPYLDEYTYDLTKNPAVTVRHGDARHFLMTTDQRFDVIAPDVFVSAQTGTAYLYNVEFFELCAARINPGGRVVLNVALDKDIDRVIAAGFVAAFPYVKLIEIPYAHFAFLVGSNEPIELPPAPCLRWKDEPLVIQRCLLLGLGETGSLVSRVVADRDEILRQLDGTRPSSDDHPVVDYLQFSNQFGSLSW